MSIRLNAALSPQPQLSCTTRMAVFYVRNIHPWPATYSVRRCTPAAEGKGGGEGRGLPWRAACGGLSGRIRQCRGRRLLLCGAVLAVLAMRARRLAGWLAGWLAADAEAIPSKPQPVNSRRRLPSDSFPPTSRRPRQAARNNLVLVIASDGEMRCGSQSNYNSRRWQWRLAAPGQPATHRFFDKLNDGEDEGADR